MEHTATYSPEDNKLRLYPAYRLDTEEYASMKANGFIWAPKQELFVAPMWTPDREDFLIRMCGEIGDEDKSLVERAEEKAERLENLSERKLDEANRAQKAVDRIADGIPFGQPILVGHHSEKHARKDAERIQNGMRKAVDCWKASGYWTERAAGALRHAKFKERPDVRARRIKTLEAEYRKQDRTIMNAQNGLKLWKMEPMTWALARRISGSEAIHLSKCFPIADYPRVPGASTYEGSMSLWGALGDTMDTGIITPEQARDLAVRKLSGIEAWAKRWADHYENRIAYERAMLDQGGGLVAEKHDIQVGGRVLVGQEWITVLKLNKKDGKLVSLSTTRRYVPVVGIEEIKGYDAPTEEHAAKVAATLKVPPMCNYPGEGFATCTDAEWKKIYADYKGSAVIKETTTEGAHRVRRAIGIYLQLPPMTPEPAPGSTESWSRKHSYYRVFITDAKRKDPPQKKALAPQLPATLDEVTPEMFEVREESGKIRAGIKWVSAQDGPQCPGECYQFDTLEALKENARAWQDEEHGIVSFKLVTHSGEYQNMRTVYEWKQPEPDIFANKIDLERMTKRTEQLTASNAARNARDAAAAPFRALEEQLKTGVKVVIVPQLFATAPELAARMAEEADIQTGHRVLEPSAGTGRILQAIMNLDRGLPAAVEINRELAERLRAEFPLTSVTCCDFLEFTPGIFKYDRVVMNPPFANGADIKHIKHATTFLNPGGRLVALCANGPRQREILKPLAENSGGWWEDLPAGTFSEQGTEVNTALLVIEA